MDEEKFTVKEEVLDLEDLILPSTSQKPNCYDLNTKSETFVKSETDIKPDNIFGISGENQNNVSIETENLPTTEKEDSVEYNLPYGWKKVGFQRKDKGGLIQGLLWTSQYDWEITTGGLTFNLNHCNTFNKYLFRHEKVRTRPILTLAMS